MNTYRVLESVTVNGATMELRKLETDNASAYVVYVRKSGKTTYANFSNASVARNAYKAVQAYAYA